MRHRLDAMLVLTALVAGPACASTGPAPDREFTSRDVLTYEQIQEVRATNAYEVVERLKSHWLRSTTPTSPGTPDSRSSPVMVYLDNQRLGYIDQLRRIEVAAIEYIQYFAPADASTRWGFGNAGGAILVVTQPPGP